MKELDLDNGSVKQVKLGGKVYEIKPLRVRDQRAMQADLKDLKQDDPVYFEVMLKHVSKCGVPSDVIEDMFPEQLKAYIEFLTDSKKD